MYPLADKKMTKQIAVSIGLLTLLTVFVSMIWPSTFNPAAVAQQQNNLQDQRRVQSFEYGRLVFSDDNYNWIAGDRKIQPATSIRSLISRLGARAPRDNFATLLDTLGSQGWELIFETEDPEGFGQVLIFKRPN